MPDISPSSWAGIGIAISAALAAAGASGEKLIPFGPLPLGTVLMTLRAAIQPSRAGAGEIQRSGSSRNVSAHAGSQK